MLGRTECRTGSGRCGDHGAVGLHTISLHTTGLDVTGLDVTDSLFPYVSSPTKHASSAKPAEVPETLKFTGTTVDHQSFDGASLAGKPTLLWFWAPWCPTCRSQIPQVQKIAKAHGADANVIGVGSLDGGAAIETFADSAPGITHLTDESGEIWRHFSVHSKARSCSSMRPARSC